MKQNLSQILQKIENLPFNVAISFSLLNFSNCTLILQFKDEMLTYSGVVRVRLLGRHSDQWLPQWYLIFLFSFWSETCAQQVQRRAMVGVQGAKPLEAPKNLHPTVPKTGSKTDQKYSDGYAFMYVNCNMKLQENFKILSSQVSYQKHNVYVLYFQLENILKI